MNIAENLPLKKANINLHFSSSIIKQHSDETRSSKQMPKFTNHVCHEFEIEVLKECNEHVMKTNTIMDKKKSNNMNQFSHRLIRQCARDIRNREYWDEKSQSYIKKWHVEKLTCDLKFSNKWVSGLLRRDSVRRTGGSGSEGGSQAIDNRSHDPSKTTSISTSSSKSDEVYRSDCSDNSIEVFPCNTDGEDDDLDYSDKKVPLAPYDDDLVRDMIAFINGKGSL